MTRLRLLTWAVVLWVMAPVALADDATPLRNWVSPIYWSPAAPGADDTGTKGRIPLSARETLAASAPLPFVAITPCRIADTRDGSYPAGYGPPQLAGGGAARTFVIPSGPCPGIPTTAGAFSLNFTVVAPGGTPPGGYLSVWPTGSPQPVVSTLNFTSGSILANAAIVPAGTGGGINLFVNFSTDLIIDINGYYAGTGLVTSVTPGTGLSGGGTGDVVLGIAPNGVTSTELAANAVISSKIAASAVTAGAIASNAAVKSLNSATGDLTLVGSGSITVGTAGSTVTVGAPSGSMLLGAPGDTTLIGAGYTEVAPGRFDYWVPTASSGAPGPRGYYTALWTGSKMIVWGGATGPGTAANDGGVYDPVTNSWTPTATTGAPQGRYLHAAVWTGSRMIVWGGASGSTALNDGGVYDPSGSGSWTATASSGAPYRRFYFTWVWTGSRMIVWGGCDEGFNNLNDGGVYDPSGSGSWTPTASSGAPTVRRLHVAVWTGSKMIVWGGFGGVYWNDGGVYDPSGSGSWSAMTTSGAPQGRYAAVAVWTGSKMIVWGGSNTGGYLNDGGVYDPSGNAWTATASPGAPSSRQWHTAIWTGSKVVIWGGCSAPSCTTLLNDGGQYDPSSNSWLSTTTSGAPSPRYAHSAIWTGSKMVVWGGTSGSSYLGDGGQWLTSSIYVKN